MKSQVLITAMIVAACFMLIQSPANSEEEKGHIYFVQTWKSTMPDGGSEDERDALLMEWVESITKKNDKIISTKNLEHVVGGDSRDWVVIVEYERWSDIAEARKINNDLIEQKWPDEIERKEYFDKLESYFPDYWHSDEILRDMPKFNK
jgi:hypothetical protein